MPSLSANVGTPLTGRLASVSAGRQSSAEREADVAIGVAEAAARDSAAEAAVRIAPTPLEQLMRDDALARFR